MTNDVTTEPRACARCGLKTGTRVQRDNGIWHHATPTLCISELRGQHNALAGEIARMCNALDADQQPTPAFWRHYHRCLHWALHQVPL